MTKQKTRKRDIAILGGPTEDGQGKQLLRLRDGTLTTGEIRPVKEGQPITSELVRLHPMDDSQRVCAVEVLHAPAANNADEPAASEPSQASSRPARVATDRYRKNWGTIFAAKSKASLN